MRSISRGAFLALLTALVLSAVAVASASAAPEFKYTGTGPKAKQFTATSGSTSFHDKQAEWACKSSKITGEIAGTSGSSKITHTFITYSGCKFLFEDVTTKGEPEGVVKTVELEGELGLVSPTVVGLLLKGKGTSEFWNATAEANGTIRERGSAIGQINSAVGKKINAANPLSIGFTYTPSTYEQKPAKFEGGETHLLEQSLGTWPFYVDGMSTEDSLVPAEGEMEVVL
jgi:hypothetical protein